jgi:hypothetical protein
MTLSLRSEFGFDLAKTTLDEIQFRRSKYYYFLGGISPWNLTDEAPTVSIPDTTFENRQIRSENVFIKRITPNDVTLVCTRYDWTPNIQYDYWDDRVEMKTKKFYVVTDEFNVYKCLDNNNTISTVKPFGTASAPIKLSDGYIWKYMYTIPVFKRTRFASPASIPVQRSLSDSFYNNGAVDDAVVVESGSGYTDIQQTTISVSGTTTGSGAIATFTIGSGGSISSVTVTNGGSGYTKGVSVSIDGGGSGAVLSATVAAGVVTGVTIVNAGAGYNIGSTLTFSVGGAILFPVVSRVTGSIERVIIKNKGIGYTSNPTLTVVGSGGTGLYPPNTTAIIQTIEKNGSIDRVNIIDPGQNYPVDNDTTISVQGDGSGAVFSPVVVDGKVIDILTENPGSGYTEIFLTINSSNGTGATALGIITQSDYSSNQSIIEQTVVPGAIYKIKIDAAGKNYSPGSYLQVTGNGTGFASSLTFGPDGSISKVNISNYGSGYTYAEIKLIDPLRNDLLIPNSEKFSGYAILPPLGGHGLDAPLELFGNTLCVNSSLRNELISTDILQDFRLFGILKNPKNIFSGSDFNNQSSLGMYEIKVNNTNGLIKDEILLFNNNKYRVVDFDIAKFSIYLLPLDNENIVPNGLLSAETNLGRQYQTSQILQSVLFSKYSGKLLYVAKENPFTFAEDQSVVVKTYITF